MPRVKILCPPLVVYISSSVKTEKKNIFQNLHLHLELLDKYDICNVQNILTILSSLDFTQAVLPA
jgi:hypothetical protein